MKRGEPRFAFLVLAERTGLEPATPGVTGRYSNRLNYRSWKLLFDCWWVLTGSNRRPTPCKGAALPTELSTLCKLSQPNSGAVTAPKEPLVYRIFQGFA